MVNLKEQVGIKAAEFVTDGMIVGLGTGSTAYYFVAEGGRLEYYCCNDLKRDL